MSFYTPPPGVRAKRNVPRTICTFCYRKLPKPKLREDVFSAEGCQGGVCSCGASFVLDVTGKQGGTALLDALMLITGDMDAAMKIQADVDYETKTEIYKNRRTVQRDILPKMWFARLLKPTGTDPADG
jgi:hypothetical protein